MLENATFSDAFTLEGLGGAMLYMVYRDHFPQCMLLVNAAHFDDFHGVGTMSPRLPEGRFKRV